MGECLINSIDCRKAPGSCVVVCCRLSSGLAQCDVGQGRPILDALELDPRGTGGIHRPDVHASSCNDERLIIDALPPMMSIVRGIVRDERDILQPVQRNHNSISLRLARNSRRTSRRGTGHGEQALDEDIPRTDLDRRIVGNYQLAHDVQSLGEVERAPVQRIARGGVQVDARSARDLHLGIQIVVT